MYLVGMDNSEESACQDKHRSHQHPVHPYVYEDEEDTGEHTIIVCIEHFNEVI